MALTRTNRRVTLSQIAWAGVEAFALIIGLSVFVGICVEVL